MLNVHSIGIPNDTQPWRRDWRWHGNSPTIVWAPLFVTNHDELSFGLSVKIVVFFFLRQIDGMRSKRQNDQRRDGTEQPKASRVRVTLFHAFHVFHASSAGPCWRARCSRVVLQEQRKKLSAEFYNKSANLPQNFSNIRWISVSTDFCEISANRSWNRLSLA